MITKCTFDYVASRGVNLESGASARVEDCRFRGGLNGVRGIVQGPTDGVVVVDCRFEGMLGNPVQITGTNNVVEDCVIKRCGGAISMRGADGTIRGNAIDGVDSNSAAIALRNATGFLIQDNTLSGTVGSAIDLDDTASTCVVVDNVAKRSVGGDNRACFAVAGDAHVLENDRAIDAGGDGFRIAGAGTKLTDCVALRCGRDGFDVVDGSTNVVLDDCVARLCAAEGLENSGAATVVNGGVFLKNRLDVANAGTLTLNGATFATGGVNVAPQIED